ncbi:MAG: choice-of-anchor tandem repeat GloVer-containing protein [Pseudomonadota bacterium]
MRSNPATSFRGAWTLVIALSAFAACAQAQTYNLRVIHRFFGAPDDGSIPGSPVQFDSAGNLYGTTLEGGIYNAGTVFEIARDGTESILHSFAKVDGSYVGGGVLTIDPATGDLYGATQGGQNDYGQIYELAADGTFTVLHDFAGPDGRFPVGSLIRDQAGNLYGVTEAGGTEDKGTIYKLTPNGTLTTLHVFIGEA